MNEASAGVSRIGLQHNIRVKAGLGGGGGFNTHGSVVHSAFAVGSESRKKGEDRMSVGSVDLVWPARGKTERKQKKKKRARRNGVSRTTHNTANGMKEGERTKHDGPFFLSLTRWLMEKGGGMAKGRRTSSLLRRTFSFLSSVRKFLIQRQRREEDFFPQLGVK